MLLILELRIATQIFGLLTYYIQDVGRVNHFGTPCHGSLPSQLKETQMKHRVLPLFALPVTRIDIAPDGIVEFFDTVVKPTMGKSNTDGTSG